MRALSSADCLALWESGARRHPLDQGLLALAQALPGTSCDTLADWPLGRRNRALAELRLRSFGSDLEGWVACPACGEKIEFHVDARRLAEEEAAPAESVACEGETFRLPTSRDLALAAREADPQAGAVRLLETCRAPASGPREWPEEAIERIGEQLAQADPLAETSLALGCPECGHTWSECLDITEFVWCDVQARARRLLLEVHELASAYGWAEREILSLSDARRAFYLEMVRA